MTTTQSPRPIRFSRITRDVKMAGKFMVMRDMLGYTLLIEGEPFGRFDTSKAAESTAARIGL